MIKEVIGSGATVEEATENAKLKLGVTDDEDIQVDVVSLPKKKVMGLFGGSSAQVKVSVERPDEKGKKQTKEKPVLKEKKETKKASKKPAKEQSKEIATVLPEELSKDSRALVAVNYLREILEKLGCKDAEMRVAEREGGALIVLNGEGLGVVIGRRGETLDALQHLSSLATRNADGYYKITLNIGNYRERREDALVSLAKRVAGDVVKSGRGKALEPMNPYERRIIHTAIQEIEGVTSASVGEGNNRRVVVVLDGHDVSEVRIMRSRRDDGDRRYNRRDRRTKPVNTTPSREPRKDGDMPLYGKIVTKTEE